jgi:hypothetical protein
MYLLSTKGHVVTHDYTKFVQHATPAEALATTYTINMHLEDYLSMILPEFWCLRSLVLGYSSRDYEAPTALNDYRISAKRRKYLFGVILVTWSPYGPSPRLMVWKIRNIASSLRPPEIMPAKFEETSLSPAIILFQSNRTPQTQTDSYWISAALTLAGIVQYTWA